MESSMTAESSGNGRETVDCYTLNESVLNVFSRSATVVTKWLWLRDRKQRYCTIFLCLNPDATNDSIEQKNRCTLNLLRLKVLTFPLRRSRKRGTIYVEYQSSQCNLDAQFPPQSKAPELWRCEIVLLSLIPPDQQRPDREPTKFITMLVEARELELTTDRQLNLGCRMPTEEPSCSSFFSFAGSRRRWYFSVRCK
ncbi:hypothetical protein TNCV_4865931 [Trichonephila clavipes]|nr:hypothetical protein TNCV_4865931 [Trichonephila clavipes]